MHAVFVFVGMSETGKTFETRLFINPATRSLVAYGRSASNLEVVIVMPEASRPASGHCTKKAPDQVVTLPAFSFLSHLSGVVGIPDRKAVAGLN